MPDPIPGRTAARISPRVAEVFRDAATRRLGPDPRADSTIVPLRSFSWSTVHGGVQNFTRGEPVPILDRTELEKLLDTGWVKLLSDIEAESPTVTEENAAPIGWVTFVRTGCYDNNGAQPFDRGQVMRIMDGRLREMLIQDGACRRSTRDEVAKAERNG